MKWTVCPQFPFDWNLKLKFSVLPYRPTPSLFKNGTWYRMVRINGRVIPVSVKSVGSVENPKLLISSPRIDGREKRKLRKMIMDFHGIGDVRELYSFMEKDSVLKTVKDMLYGFGKAGRMAIGVYEGVVKAIIQQQISLKVAMNIIANIVERYGEKEEIEGNHAYDFPSPEKIARLEIQQLKNCGLSRRKAEYIKNFSEEVVNGFDPEKLRRERAEKAIETLTSFKGIGRWTAELVMAAVAGKNVVPAADLGVRRAISHFYFGGKMLDEYETRKFIENKFGKHAIDCIVYLLMAYRLVMMHH